MMKFMTILMVMFAVTFTSCTKKNDVKPQTQSSNQVVATTYKAKWGKYFSNQTWNFVADVNTLSYYDQMKTGSYTFADYSTYVNSNSSTQQSYYLNMTTSFSVTVSPNALQGHAWDEDWSGGELFGMSINPANSSGSVDVYFAIISVDDNNLVMQEMVYVGSANTMTVDNTKPQLIFTK